MISALCLSVGLLLGVISFVNSCFSVVSFQINNGFNDYFVNHVIVKRRHRKSGSVLIFHATTKVNLFRAVSHQQYRAHSQYELWNAIECRNQYMRRMK